MIETGKRNIRIFIVLLVFFMANVVLIEKVNAVSELTVDQRLRIEFPDLGQAGWAESDIRLLTIRGVLGGFPDGTFRPNAPIKKIEALVMAVRTLGLEWEAKELEKKDDPQFFILEGKDLDWAKGYLSAAYRNGLISNYLQEFNWYDPADRLWMAELMVRMVRMEDEAKSITYPLYFTDRHQILPNRQGYVQLVQREGLMSGYPDNTFRPNVAMTRAELAVLFNNYFDKYMTDYTLLKHTYATIEQFNAETGTILLSTRDKGIQQFTVNKQAVVFYKPNTGNNTFLEKRSYNQLQKGQQIDYIVSGKQQLVFITILSDGYGSFPVYTPNYQYDDGRERYYVGYLRGYKQSAASSTTVTLEDLAGKQNHYFLAPQASITNRQGNITSLQTDKLYRYILTKGADGESRIRSLEEQDDTRHSFTGDYLMFNSYSSELTIKHSQLQSETFIVPEGITLDIQPNDYVRIYTYGKYLYDWQVIRPVYDEGYFIKYNKDYRELSLLDKQGRNKIYRVTENPRIQIPRVSRPDINNIYENDYIRVSFDRYDQNKNGIFDEIIEISVVDQFTGTIIRKRSESLEFIDENGLKRELDVIKNVKINISGIRNATIDDLRVNDVAYFKVERGKIAQIDVSYRKVEEGYIYNVRGSANGSKQLILGENTYNQRAYNITAKTNIHWNRYSNLSVDELKYGVYVKVWFDGDDAVDIEIIDTGTVQGIVTDYASQSVWLDATADKGTRFFLAEHITNGSGYVDKMVTLYFREGVVDKIEIIPEQTDKYSIVHVDIGQRKLWVRDEDNKHKVFFLPKDEIIYEGYKQYVDKLEGRLTVKRRIQLQVVNETVVKISNEY